MSCFHCPLIWTFHTKNYIGRINNIPKQFLRLIQQNPDFKILLEDANKKSIKYDCLVKNLSKNDIGYLSQEFDTLLY